MTKLPRISAKDLIKILQKAGFNIIRQKGSHIKLRRLKPIRKTIIVPNHKIIRPGTLNNILEMAEINKKDIKN